MTVVSVLQSLACSVWFCGSCAKKTPTTAGPPIPYTQHRHSLLHAQIHALLHISFKCTHLYHKRLIYFLLPAALFTLHSYVQGQVLARQGAMAVGIVNAMRAAAVSLVSAALFCGPDSPQQCLTVYAGASAAIISAGGVLWAVAGVCWTCWLHDGEDLLLAWILIPTYALRRNIEP